MSQIPKNSGLPPKPGMPWEAKATIFAAIIGLVGVLISSFIGYMGARTTIELPLHATQTAEARFANTPLLTVTAVSDAVASQTPTATLAIVPTRTPNPVPNATPAISPTATILPFSFDVSDFAGCYPTLLPESFRPDLNPKQTYAAFNDVPVEDKNRWGRVASPKSLRPEHFLLDFWLESLVKGTEWIRLDHTLKVEVRAHRAPDHLNVYQESCGGGGGEARDFPALNLRAEADNSTLRTTFSRFDYFTLKPGEVEEFHVPLICREPGEFDVSVTLSYVLSGKESTAIWNSPAPFICPKTMTLWSSDNGDRFGNQVKYEWDGQDYISTP